jgi:hypothetical protein
MHTQQQIQELAGLLSHSRSAEMATELDLNQIRSHSMSDKLFNYA